MPLDTKPLRGVRRVAGRNPVKGTAPRRPSSIATRPVQKSTSRLRGASPQMHGERGGCLTVWLIINLVVAPLGFVSYLFAGAQLRQSLPYLAGWAIPFMAVLCLVDFVSVLAIWKWQKWGVYGWAAVAIVASVINFIGLGVCVGPLTFVGGFIGAVIFAMLIRPIWHQMD